MMITMEERGTPRSECLWIEVILLLLSILLYAEYVEWNLSDFTTYMFCVLSLNRLSGQGFQILQSESFGLKEEGLGFVMGFNVNYKEIHRKREEEGSCYLTLIQYGYRFLYHLKNLGRNMTKRVADGSYVLVTKLTLITISKYSRV